MEQLMGKEWDASDVAKLNELFKEVTPNWEDQLHQILCQLRSEIIGHDGYIDDGKRKRIHNLYRTANNFKAFIKRAIEVAGIDPLANQSMNKPDNDKKSKKISPLKVARELSKLSKIANE